GDGTFREPSDIGDHAYYWTTVADFDGDGELDLAGTNFEGQSDVVNVLLGNGDGTFQPEQFFVAGFSPGPINVADMNRDSVLDLVVTNRVAVRGLTVLLGTGDGSFGPPITTVAGSDLYVSTSLAVADFNSDGLPDAALTNYVFRDSGSVSVFRNDGTWP